MANESPSATSSTQHRRQILCANLGIFILALLLRGVYYLEVGTSPLFSVLLGDGRQYYAWALEIASGSWLGQEVFYQAPLYPYFLAALIAVFGPGFWPLRLAQLLLGATSCVLLAVAGRRFFSDRVGLVAGVLLAVYPPAVFFDGLIQKTSLGLFLTTALLALLGELDRRVSPRWLLLAGLVLGCLALTRENALLLVPILGLWIFVHFAQVTWRRRVGWAAVFIGGLAVVLIPVGLHNWMAGGRFLLTTSQLGSNFYIGNNLDADGKYRPLLAGREDARVERFDAVKLAEAEAGSELSPAEVSAYWLDRSLSYIRSHPGHWVRLLLRKSFLVVNATELVDTESIEAYGEQSRLLSALSSVLHFGVVGPLAFLGLWTTRRGWSRLWILYAIALAMALSLVFFYVLARYRFPLVALAILFAAAGLTEIWESVKAKSLRRHLRNLGLLAAAAVVQNWPPGIETSPRATTYYNLGVALFEQGDDDRAAAYLEKVLTMLPDLADAHFSLGNVLVQQGRLQEGLRHYEQALQSDPGHADAHHRLGELLAQLQQPGPALRQLRRAVELRPDLTEARWSLARLLADQRRYADAMAQYHELLKLDPQHAASAHSQLGHLLILQGELDEAAKHLRRAFTLDPQQAMAHNLLGNILAAQGRTEEAVRQYRQALQIEPDLGDAHFKLGLLLTEAGHLTEARHHLEETIRLLPSFAEAYRRLAAVLATQGDRDRAEPLIRRAMELESTATAVEEKVGS